jgi:5-methyltetrahydrofolate--homocysteine methyltransferase
MHVTEDESPDESDRTHAGTGREKIVLTYDWGPDGKPVQPENQKAFSGIRLNDQSLLKEIFPLVNPGMLYKKHLGFRGNTKDAEKSGDPKFLELKKLITELQNDVIKNQTLKIDGYYRFFKAASDGNDLVIFDNSGKELNRFHFKRQSKGWQLCLSDFVAPLNSTGKAEKNVSDHVALFVVTAGIGVREEANRLKEEGSYLRSHALSALALESAEGFAEYVHRRIRSEWGIADQKDFTSQELYSMKYQGARFSFGYPACPELSDQKKLFELLNAPDDIGVKLTEGFSMDPEASVSALVFAHPQARYFAVD